MSENNGFEFKVKIAGYSYDFDKQEYYYNGFVKTYFAKDFEELKQVFINFVNGENRFINLKFDGINKCMKFTKRTADDAAIESELSYGLGYFAQISDKLHFALTSNGNIHYWDRLDSETFSNSYLNEFCDDNEMVEYVATVRLVVKKEDKLL